MTTQGKKKGNILLKVPVAFFEEDGTWLAYCPSLNLSTYGRSKKQVESRFEETIQIFLEDVLSKGTLDEYLRTCGWTAGRKKYTPPPLGIPIDKFEDLRPYTLQGSQLHDVMIPAS